jgi:hypothetical protein
MRPIPALAATDCEEDIQQDHNQHAEAGELLDKANRHGRNGSAVAHGSTNARLNTSS